MTVKAVSSHFRERLRLGKGQARLLRLLGYPLFAFAVFLVSMYLSLPTERIKERLERELSQEPGPSPAGSGGLGIGIGMDVAIGQLDLHVLPLGISASESTLRPRRFSSSAPDEGEHAKLPPLSLDQLYVRPEIFAFLGGRLAADLSAEALGGSLTASGGISDSGIDVRAEFSKLALARAASVLQFLPLPLTGTVGGQIDAKVPARKVGAPAARDGQTRRSALSVPPLDYSKATGLIEIKLEKGVLGDGKAKLSVPGDPFLSQGLTFPRLSLGDLNGRLVLDRGRATLSDVHTRSADAEIWVEGYVELRDPLPLSEMHLYLRFLPSAALTQREATMEILSSAMAAGKRSDGSLGFAVSGTFASPRARPSREPPDGVTVRAGSLGQVGKDAAPALRSTAAVHAPSGLPPAFTPPAFTPPPPPLPAPPPPPSLPPPSPPPAYVPPPILPAPSPPPAAANHPDSPPPAAQAPAGGQPSSDSNAEKPSSPPETPLENSRNQ